MSYVLQTGYAAVGDLGVAPCPPPDGCPPGTQQNPSYPAHSATCCKPIPGYVAPPTGPSGGSLINGGTTGLPGIHITPGAGVIPGGTTGQPQKPPVGGVITPSTGGATPPAAVWYEQYKWYLIGGSALLVVVTAALLLLGRKPTAKLAPATADFAFEDF